MLKAPFVRPRSPQQSLGKGAQLAGGSDNLASLFQEPSLNALLAAHMRNIAAEVRQGPFLPTPEPPRARLRETGVADPEVRLSPRKESASESTKGQAPSGRRLMTLQDTAEAIGLIPKSRLQNSGDSGCNKVSLVRTGPRETPKQMAQAPQRENTPPASPKTPSPPVVLILDAEGQLRRFPLLEGRVVAVIAQQQTGAPESKREGGGPAHQTADPGANQPPVTVPTLVDRARKKGQISADFPSRPPPLDRIARLEMQGPSGGLDARRAPMRSGPHPSGLPAGPTPRSLAISGGTTEKVTGSSSLAQRLLASSRQQPSVSVPSSGIQRTPAEEEGVGYEVPVRAAVFPLVPDKARRPGGSARNPASSSRKGPSSNIRVRHGLFAAADNCRTRWY